MQLPDCAAGRCDPCCCTSAFKAVLPGCTLFVAHFSFFGWNLKKTVHLLMAGLANSQLAPRSTYSCLTVLLEGAIHGMLLLAQPQMHERCLAILNQLASTPTTRRPTLDVLRSNSILLQQLNDVGCASLASGPDQVSQFLLRVLLILVAAGLTMMRLTCSTIDAGISVRYPDLWPRPSRLLTNEYNDCDLPGQMSGQFVSTRDRALFIKGHGGEGVVGNEKAQGGGGGGVHGPSFHGITDCVAVSGTWPFIPHSFFILSVLKAARYASSWAENSAPSV